MVILFWFFSLNFFLTQKCRILAILDLWLNGICSFCYCWFLYWNWFLILDLKLIIPKIELEESLHKSMPVTSGPKKSTKRKKGSFECSKCGRIYIRKDSLQRHQMYECDKEPQFPCPFCPQKCKRRSHQIRHITRQHPEQVGMLQENNPEAKLFWSL